MTTLDTLLIINIVNTMFAIALPICLRLFLREVYEDIKILLVGNIILQLSLLIIQIIV